MGNYFDDMGSKMTYIDKKMTYITNYNAWMCA